MTSSQHSLWPDVVVSIHSPRWMAAVQRAALNHEQVQLHWQASVKDAFSCTAGYHGAAVIIEWPKSTTPDSFVELLATFTNNPYRALPFVLGDQQHEPFRDALSRSVAGGVATSILDFDFLWRRVVSHLQSHEITGLSVEELVEARFPFP